MSNFMNKKLPGCEFSYPLCFLFLLNINQGNLLPSFATVSDPLENSKEDLTAEQSMLLHPADHEGLPRMAPPGPGPMHGPRPGMPPMQHPATMPNPHLGPYLHPPNMAHMPPGMVPGGSVFPPDRLRIPMPFPHRGPPFHRHPAMGPEVMGDRDGPRFQNGRPGFGYPGFPRGRW